MTDLEEVPDVPGVPDSATVAVNDGDRMRDWDRDIWRDTEALKRVIRLAETQGAATSATVIVFLMIGVMFGIGFTLTIQAVIP